ncbi:hypothetical protein [Saltwater crocodilepox virus]|nr:hypothetical protein [Saltwater crocodilepox virus]QGT49285.1 ORF061 [Saltwater crocodilepox virus]
MLMTVKVSGYYFNYAEAELHQVQQRRADVRAVPVPPAVPVAHQVGRRPVVEGVARVVEEQVAIGAQANELLGHLPERRVLRKRLLEAHPQPFAQRAENLFHEPGRVAGAQARAARAGEEQHDQDRVRDEVREEAQVAGRRLGGAEVPRPEEFLVERALADVAQARRAYARALVAVEHRVADDAGGVQVPHRLPARAAAVESRGQARKHHAHREKAAQIVARAQEPRADVRRLARRARHVVEVLRRRLVDEAVVRRVLAGRQHQLAVRHEAVPDARVLAAQPERARLLLDHLQEADLAAERRVLALDLELVEGVRLGIVHRAVEGHRARRREVRDDDARLVVDQVEREPEPGHHRHAGSHVQRVQAHVARVEGQARRRERVVVAHGAVPGRDDQVRQQARARQQLQERDRVLVVPDQLAVQVPQLGLADVGRQREVQVRRHERRLVAVHPHESRRRRVGDVAPVRHEHVACDVSRVPQRVPALGHPALVVRAREGENVEVADRFLQENVAARRVLRHVSEHGRVELRAVLAQHAVVHVVQAVAQARVGQQQGVQRRGQDEALHAEALVEVRGGQPLVPAVDLDRPDQVRQRDVLEKEQVEDVVGARRVVAAFERHAARVHGGDDGREVGGGSHRGSRDAASATRSSGSARRRSSTRGVVRR